MSGAAIIGKEKICGLNQVDQVADCLCRTGHILNFLGMCGAPNNFSGAGGGNIRPDQNDRCINFRYQQIDHLNIAFDAPIPQRQGRS